MNFYNIWKYIQCNNVDPFNDIYGLKTTYLIISEYNAGVLHIFSFFFTTEDDDYYSQV